jgi:hypothetical protein
VYRKFKKEKSLTTQVVRRFNFKNENKCFIKDSIVRIIQRGRGRRSEEESIDIICSEASDQRR